MAEEPITIPNAFAPVSKDAWRAQVEADLKGKPLSTLNTTLEPGITLQPLYTQGDVPTTDTGFPGLPPFTRDRWRRTRFTSRIGAPRSRSDRTWMA